MTGCAGKGFLQLTVAKEWGGAGASFLDHTIAYEALGQGCPSTALVVQHARLRGHAGAAERRSFI